MLKTNSSLLSYLINSFKIRHLLQIYPALCAFDFSTTLLAMEPSRIPNKLRFFRRLCGYSQKKIARMLGLNDTNAISRWEQGAYAPNIKNLFKLSQIYHVYPHELYPGLWEESIPEEYLSAQQTEQLINQIPSP